MLAQDDDDPARWRFAQPGDDRCDGIHGRDLLSAGASGIGAHDPGPMVGAFPRRYGGR
jgi:hypothetical protein